MTRRTFLASSSAAAAAAQTPRRRPPNFIVIYTDDQGIGDMGCYGARDLKTPNMDRLAARGVRFASWYTNSPVCSPSRCALMTGQYPARHGIMNFLPARATHDVPGLKPGAVTLPGELRKLGYRTAAVGKWHLGSEPASRPLQQGFDEHFGFYSGWNDYYSHRYYNMSRTAPEHIFRDLWRKGEEVFEDPAYSTELFTREAKAFIKRQKKDQPFFLYLAHGAPHYPMIAPKKYMDRVPASLGIDRRLHAAMLVAVDDGIGEILDLLQRRGLDRDTVIFFQSDNGSTSENRSNSHGRPYRGGSNAPFRGYKGGLFEGGIRMPALMSWPGVIPAGAVVDAPGQTMDVMPTFLAWASATAMPPALDGVNAAGVIAQRGPSPHIDLFWEYQGQLAIRRGNWKLMLGPKLGLNENAVAPRWLSNLKEDPAEQRNWMEQAPGDLVAALEKRLRKWAGQLKLG
ncbi:MAG: sulfatase [Acidobacteria bacterium]|nr:sulfatase [Acidobacteriota bacterium]